MHVPFFLCLICVHSRLLKKINILFCRYFFITYILSYSAFSTNIPNLPIQIMAVTDTGGANAFFSNDLSHLLITEGNAIADKLEAHFMTSASSCQQKSKKLQFLFLQYLTNSFPNASFCNVQPRFTRPSSKWYGKRNRRLSRRLIWRSQGI